MRDHQELRKTNLRFYKALSQCFKARMKADQDFRYKVWSALANVTWIDSKGCETLISFRMAGDWIASIVRERGYMDYMQYYCMSDPGIVDDEIAKAMAAKGWTFRL